MLLFFWWSVIAYIEGQIFLLEQGYAVVKTNGIGYQVFLCQKDYQALAVSQTISLYVHSHIREDAFELYGFISSLERQLFLLLISVSGVGPKLALAALSHLSPHELIDALINKDIATLSSVPGIGKKTGERLSLELKDKAMKIDYSKSEQPLTSQRASLEQAIKSLGYTKAQSDKAILLLDHDDLLSMPLEALIKKTLTVLSGNKS